MQIIKITATRRQQAGKGAAGRVRKIGQVPAVAYGRDLPAQPLAVAPEQLKQVLGSELGRNSVVEVDVEGQEKFTALLCDYQYHPVTREFLHADFFQIRMDQEVNVDVALELTGKPVGVTLGGTLRQVFRALPLRCLPDKIPVKITHDITALGLDGHVAVRDLQLPEGVKVRLAPERTLVAIVKEKQAPEEEQAAAPGAAPAAAKAAAAGKSVSPPAKEDKK